MSESANRQSEGARDRGDDSSADKSKAGQQAQKDAALTRPRLPASLRAVNEAAVVGAGQLFPLRRSNPKPLISKT